ncbi:uncharacterized protein M421DRAFT_8861 [Didymella exigua CBS 183.55]|uniref:F-box domain-containing protein n=1 Tax=Didymella exigua CBS 183.55 TaxID=1150837 RepID=A0A6A5RA32_9PLEO|nr:uncharacterized protein M421DRAFT_8861 [Didymella exigua CBS 183.55]KAF1924383.1 hypothetical protein M421DRAFT_8861 [Didymella exigua CBS 183.55]
MPRHISDSDGEEPLEDTTAALSLKSKRTERMQRRKVVRDRKKDAMANLTKLPTELLLECLAHVTPRDVFSFSLASRRFHALVAANTRVVGDVIIARRYALLAQCFPTPRLLSDVEPAIQKLMADASRQTQLSIHKRPYTHIQPPDAQQLCTCLTCILTWNNLGLVLDFAHWQSNLDDGVPIAIIPQGRTAEWNDELVARNARIVRKAVKDSLWHARILELHLDSTVRSIKRHLKNKGNKRTHVDMADADVDSGADTFLSKHGPPSLEFPYQRDEYYMLEAYLPNRWWKKAEQRWVYIIAGQHERDLEMVQRFGSRYAPSQQPRS